MPVAETPSAGSVPEPPSSQRSPLAGAEHADLSTRREGLHLTGGQLLVESLAAQGVRRIFGIPGVQLDAACDALYGASDRIAFTCVRNEQAATYMADGYARGGGGIGVAMVVPGPGVLNALAGLATAYSTSSRVLLLAGQIDSAAIGKGYGALHELPDQSGILQRLTKWTGCAATPGEIPQLVARAFTELRSGRPQPVALELPPDVLAAIATAGQLPLAQALPYVPDTAMIEAAADMLVRSRRPLIYVGGGVLAAAGAGASDSLARLAESLEAPVLVSESGRGSIDARHRLAFDALALRVLREEADVVLAVGTRFMTGFGRRLEIGDADLILLNADVADLGEPRGAQLGILADAALGLEALCAAVGVQRRESRATELADVRAWVSEQFKDVAPQLEYLSAIRAALGDDGVLVSEFTQVGYVAGMAYEAHRPGDYIGPGYEGALGYGFATALGVKAVDPQRPVISITGDGGFAWTMQELSTAKRDQLGVVTVIFNDGHFGNVRRIQKNNYGGRYFASELTNPSYELLAEAFGIAYAKARTPAELASQLTVAVAANVPILIEVPVGEFPSPWHLIHEGVPSPKPPASGADPLQFSATDGGLSV